MTDYYSQSEEKEEKRGALLDLTRKSIIIVPLIAYLLVFISLLVVTKTTIELMFIGTTPFLFYLIFFFVMFKEKKLSYRIVWILPLIFPAVFLFIWSAKIFSIMNAMDGPQLAVFNIIISYMANVLFMMGYGKEQTEERVKIKEKIKKVYVKDDKEIKELHKIYSEQSQRYESEINYLKQRIAYYEEQLKITSKNLTVSLRSIEDKCKSINFVIGRVYADRNGGSKELRSTLNIDRQLYNAFSDIARGIEEEGGMGALEILNQLYQRLIVLEYPEKEILLKGTYDKLKLEREKDGKDQILMVLAKNDKDPILDYYAEAKEICVKLIDYIQKK